jgi:lysophospholipase L1-like esterase
MPGLWIVVILVFAAGIYAAFVLRTLMRSIAISKRLIAKGDPYEQHPQDSRQRILFAGDSTAVGVGTSDNRNSIAGRIGAQYPRADIRNIAVSGDRLADLEKRLASLEMHEGMRYDLIFLQIGANDITHFVPYAAMRAQLSRILATSAQSGERTIVLTAGNIGLSPAFKWPLSQIMTARTRKTRMIFKRVIERHAHMSYVDLYHEAGDEIFNTDIARYYAVDLFHPSDDGYGVWFAKLKGVIEE